MINDQQQINKLNYFGTALDCAGHFFWELSGNRMSRNGISFSDLPFDPENLISRCEKGSVKYFRFDNYAVCAIEGSCADGRSGTHSIFWTTEPMRLGEFKIIIDSIPIAKIL